MKTYESFYNEVQEDRELSKRLAESVQAGTVENLLQELDVEGNYDGFKRYLLTRMSTSDEAEDLTMDELERVAGGTDPFPSKERCMEKCFVGGKYVSWADVICGTICLEYQY